MLKIALIFGGIAGSVVIGVMIVGMLTADGHGEGTGGQTFGYLVMIVALTMIFIGVKRYRDRDLGGVIKFGPAFLLGLMIAGVAGVMYVAGWEAFLASTDYAFIEDYTAGLIAKKEAAGATADELEKLRAQMAALVEQYGNPFFRLPMTFLEIFPVGLIIALISAALLRNPKLLPARG